MKNMKKSNDIEKKNIVRKEAVIASLALIAALGMVTAGKSYAQTQSKNTVSAKDKTLNVELTKDDSDVTFTDNEGDESETIIYESKPSEEALKDFKARKSNVKSYDKVKEASLEVLKYMCHGETVDCKLIEVDFSDGFDPFIMDDTGKYYPIYEYTFIYNVKDLDNLDDSAIIITLNAETLTIVENYNSPSDAIDNNLGTSRNIVSDLDKDLDKTFNTSDIK